MMRHHNKSIATCTPHTGPFTTQVRDVSILISMGLQIRVEGVICGPYFHIIKNIYSLFPLPIYIGK